MNDSPNRESANDIRKAGKYPEALEMYKAEWETRKDKFVAAGYINCLRNMNRHHEIFPIIDQFEEVFHKDRSFNWLKVELIWTQIHGKVNKFTDETPLAEVVSVANTVLGYEPME